MGFLKRNKQPPPPLAPYDDLMREIHRVLDAGVAEPRDEFKGQGGKYNGYCFVACEAYYRLARDADRSVSGLASDPAVKLRFFPKRKPGQASRRRGKHESHYWLVNSGGEILDLTYGPRERPDYEHYMDEGVGGRGIPNPSREATAIVDAVKRNLRQTP